MGLEIERKFLVKNNDWKKNTQSSDDIKQGYLSTDAERTVRIRTKNNQAFVTIKGKSIGLTRSEFEYEIPINDAIEMLKLCKPGIIEKTRHYIKYQNHIWELDVFKGDNQGLIVVEIELESENESFISPDWLGEEVTSDSRYFNSYLSKNSFVNWK